MEENLMTRLPNATAPQVSEPIANKLAKKSSGPKTRSLNLWPNGDVMLTWHVFRHAIARCGQHRRWEPYRHELSPSRDLTAPIPGPSPSIKAEFVRSDTTADKVYSDTIMSNDIMADAPTPGLPELSLIQNYVVNIHSKSPILDLEFLRKLEDELLKDSELQYWPTRRDLPAGLEPPDMAILLLVLALGAVVTGELLYVDLEAMESLVICGNNSCKGRDNITQDLWNRYPGILEEKLSHRVLWAVAKMQLELTEEIYPHLGLLKQGKLGQLIQSTPIPPIPPPPPQPFEWPSIGSQLDTDTWYYYLAETSSRRLVERIKAELYNGDNSDSGDITNIAASYPLACELERQINEWMSSLPADFRGTSQLLSENSLATAFNLEQAIKQRMRKVLVDRQGQLLMLVFRPFLAALADTEPDTNRSMTGNDDSALLKGTARYLYFAIRFLVQQNEQPVRHYGCWLLARNIWSTALSLIAACYIPAVVRYMDSEDMNDQSIDSVMSLSPMFHGSFAVVSQGTFVQKSLAACKDAYRLLKLWDGESKSLSFCASQLSTLIAETQWYDARMRSSNPLPQ
ncbi:unnamed protein product [Fusarium venenatum]|uniref:Transcription factor domain-containing protein n=1 Tax=Fusarium venenatum TaxID=56646 RepID=A0A2L2TZA3_9HYPO|nr:uncharacterized protein FVRRES_10553 [Fusarium venenatum]CEI70476.1 unnamed protein product [Fusarium venenatum]